jgi:hypothetical protein
VEKDPVGIRAYVALVEAMHTCDPIQQHASRSVPLMVFAMNYVTTFQVIECFSDKINHLGPVGSGHLVKAR